VWLAAGKIVDNSYNCGEALPTDILKRPKISAAIAPQAGRLGYLPRDFASRSRKSAENKNKNAVGYGNGQSGVTTCRLSHFLH
jgi:hypothetical protein